MAKTTGKDYSRLQNTLVNSRVAVDNKALYQVLQELINGASDFHARINESFKKVDDLSATVDDIAKIKFNYYIPNFTPITNIASFIAYSTRFQLNERSVQVYGKLNVTSTAANILTEIDIELPLSSVFTLEEQVQGVINGLPLDGGTVGFAGIAVANLTTLNSKLQFYPPSTDNFDARFIINYERLKV